MNGPGFAYPALTFLGSILAAGGGGALIAWQIFKSMGEKWIDSKFAESLEEYKHAKQKELENLRFEIAALMDRTVKLHQREFDVIPEAWGLLTDAFTILRPVSLGIGMAPDLRVMSPAQFEYFIKTIPLEDFQKEELRNADDKSKYYLDAIQRYDFNRALEACAAFHIYITKNGIFMPPAIKKKFADFDDLLADVLGERRQSLKNSSQNQKFDKGAALHDNGPSLLQSLEDDVQGRLWNSITSEKPKQ